MKGTRCRKCRVSGVVRRRASRKKERANFSCFVKGCVQGVQGVEYRV